MELNDWWTGLGRDATAAAESFAGYLPKLLGASLLLLAGWLAARVLRRLSIRVVALVDHAWMQWILRAGATPPARQPPVEIIGGIVFWIAILFFVTLAAELLGLAVFANWLGRLVGYLPTLLAGGLIALTGVLMSTVARDLVVTASGTAGMAQGPLLGRIVQIVVLVTALVIGADQIGIDVTFLAVVAGIVLGTVGLALAIAFGLGARAMVANSIAARHAAHLYRVGDHVQIGSWRGTLVDFTSNAVVLETSEGRVAIPPARFLDEVSVQVLDDGGPRP